MAKVLVADDDAAALDAMTRVLEAEGHDVLEAVDGHEAVELALRELPDMAFLAVTMPHFNGYEVCQLLREDPSLHQDLPIILLSSVDIDSRTLDKSGATACLARNHLVSELRDLLVECLGPKAVP